MRPRVFPAEDGLLQTWNLVHCSSFNEAAGIPRGRLARGVVNTRPTYRFNEAAGIPRGRRHLDPTDSPVQQRFNEAAGIPRGRLTPRGTRTSPGVGLQ